LHIVQSNELQATSFEKELAATVVAGRCGKVQSRSPMAARGEDVRAVFQETCRREVVPRSNREHERSDIIFPSSLKIGVSSSTEDVTHGRVTTASGEVKWGPPFVALAAHVRTQINQQATGCALILECGYAERCVSEFIFQFEFGSMQHEMLDDGFMSFRSREVQSRAAKAIRRRRMSLLVQQQSNRPQRSSGGSAAQRRHAKVMARIVWIRATLE
jgi:hypothetical protein